MSISIHSKYGDCLFTSEQARTVEQALVEAVEANVFLMGALLPNVQLQGADLRGASLPGADLRGANLAGANLSQATLNGADLTGADVTAVDFTEADLARVTCAGADFTGANFTRALLWTTDFDGAKGVIRIHGIDASGMSDGALGRPIEIHREADTALMIPGGRADLIVNASGMISIGCRTHPYGYWARFGKLVAKTQHLTDAEYRAYEQKFEQARRWLEPRVLAVAIADYDAKQRDSGVLDAIIEESESARPHPSAQYANESLIAYEHQFN